MPNANRTEAPVRKLTLRLPHGLAKWVDGRVEEQNEAFRAGKATTQGSQQHFFMQLVLDAKAKYERGSKLAKPSRASGSRRRGSHQQAA